MSYPKQVYDRAWAELERRKTHWTQQSAQRRDEIHAKIPEIAAIERAMSATAARLTRIVIASGDRAQEAIAELARENLAAQEKRALLLERSGYARDYLSRRNYCEKCRDSGYVGIEMCSCLRELLRGEAFSLLTTSSQAEDMGFDSFSLEYYPQEPGEDGTVSPRKKMSEIFAYCRRYAEEFTPDAQSVLLIGQTGLGKTHLSLAIASQVTAAGFGVIYTPVQKLLGRLESEKFSYNQQARENYSEYLASAIDCDLLVLDDLGTEFATQFTASVLYNIINSRQVEGRPSIISTNLSLSEMEDRYSQRMVSRLVCGYKVLAFAGRDIRYMKKMRG